MATWLIVAGGLGSHASAQGVQTGILRGTAVDQQNLPLPGVLVTISSPASQGERVTRTDSEGNYIFRSLPPGDYEINFELAGFANLRRTAVVPLGGAIDLNIAMNAAGPTEQVQVVAAAPTPEPTVGLRIRQEEIDALPTSRTLSGIATLSPNVNDNAPNASSGQVVISGSFAFDNLFMLNGVDVNDNVFGNPQSLFIEDAIAETQVLTSGISAEWGRFSGGVINAITKSGGNTFSGSYRLNLSNPSWVAETPFEIDNDVEHESDLSQTQEATFGGPISLDRLWFFAAGRLANVVTAGTLDVTAQPYSQRDENRRAEIKITGTAAANQTFQGGYVSNYTETSDRPSLGDSIDQFALITDQRPNWYMFGNYRGVLGDNLFAEVQYSERRMAFENSGGTDTALVNSPFLTITQESAQYNAPYFDGNDPEERNNRQLTGNVTTFLQGHGRHELKAGYEFYRSQLTGGGGQSATDYIFYSDYAVDDDGVPILDADGRLIPVFVPFTSEYDNWRPVRGAVLNIDTQAFFAQDHWAISPNLTADVGLRIELAHSAATGNVEGVDTTAFSPRVALSYDPTGQGKVTINTTYAHYSGRYNEAQMSANNNVGQPNVLFGFYVGPEGQGRDFAPGFDPNNYVIYSGRFPVANVFFDDELASPMTKEFSLSVGGQIGARAYAQVSYMWRDASNLVEDFVEISNGVTTVTEAGEPLGTFTNSIYRNTDLADRRYQGLIFQGRVNPSSQWTLSGHWTVQLKNEGNYNGEAAGQPGLVSVIGDFPEAFSEERHYPMGRLPSYQRHRARLWSLHRLALGSYGDLSLSGLLRVESGRVYSLTAGGLPLTPQQLALIADYPDSPPGQEVFFSGRGSESFRGYAAVDFAVDYDIPVWQDVRPWAKFEVFNVLNNDKQIGWSTFIAPDSTSARDALGLPTGYIQAPSFGRAVSSGHYPAARSFRVSLGIRF
jgi:hypothetical protein